jgi:hypothetical protein
MSDLIYNSILLGIISKVKIKAFRNNKKHHISRILPIANWYKTYFQPAVKPH